MLSFRGEQARTDVQSLATSLEGLQTSAAAPASRSSSGGEKGARDGAILGHLLLWSAVLSTYLCGRTMGNLEFKLLLTVMIPVCYSHPPPPSPTYAHTGGRSLAPMFHVLCEPQIHMNRYGLLLAARWVL